MSRSGDEPASSTGAVPSELLLRVQRRLFEREPARPGRRRYELEEKLGEGAMGVVWRARDPALDRPLAIKVMRTASPEMHARMLAEGRALARLSHPHVVQIYEVDDSAGEVALVMEYVRGATLREWAAGQSWRATLRACVEAGQGLAAVHACGLVHRDFKPDNVLVDGRGRARVVDFGLARRLDADAVAVADDGYVDVAPHLTRTGARVGTPAYMAPEQAGGAISDQFSFCVSVYEVLYGARPFPGAAAERRARIERGQPMPPPADTPVPARIFAVLRRGLDPVPARRWPDMPALLAALSDDPSRARARRRQFGVVALAAATLGGWSSEPPHASVCSGAARHLAGVWDADTRVTLRRAVEATGAPFARDSAAAAIAALDAYADRWVAAHTDACAATHARGEQSEALLDARMRCLADRLVDLRARIDVLHSTDAATVHDVVAAAQRLPDVDACADPVALSSTAPPPNLADRVAVERQRVRLAEVRALTDAGRVPQAYRLAEATLHAATDIGDAALIAEAGYHAGELATRQSLYARGEALLLTSYLAAERLGMAVLARDAAWNLASNIGYSQERVAEGERWASVAEAKAAHLGDPVALGGVLLLRGNLASARGAYAEALAYDRAAVAEFERARGPGHPDVARAVFNLGVSLAADGDLAGAEAAQRRVLAAIEPELGPGHPQVAAIYNELGNLAGRAKRWDEAKQHHTRALAVWSACYEPDHCDIAVALKNLGVDENRSGDPDAAMRHLVRSLAIREARLGADHSETIHTVQAIATIHREQGRLDEALRGYTRVLAVRQQKYGEHSRDLVPPLLGLGLVYERRGAVGPALAYTGRAAAIAEQHGGVAQYELLAPLLSRLRSSR